MAFLQGCFLEKKIMEIKNTKLNDYIKIFDSIVKEETLENFIEICNNHNFEAGKIVGKNGKNVVEQNTRKTDVWALSNLNSSLTTVHWYNFFQKVFGLKYIEYMNFFSNNRVGISVPNIFDIQVLKYKKNFYYKFHVDQSSQNNRQWSGIFFVNDNYKGGDLIFSTPCSTSEIKIEKKKNRLVIWPSNFMYPHTVLPVTEGIRYSIVSWAQ